MATPSLVWTRLHLPRPLDEARVLSLLLSLASDRRSPSLVFELRADKDGVTHLLGCDKTAVQRVKRLAADHLPGVAFSTAPQRHPMQEAGSLRLRPRSMPLRTDNPSDVTRALLSAISIPLHGQETCVVQLILGRRRPPRALHADTTSPQLPWWQPLLGGTRPASTDERRQLRVRAEDAGFDALVRVGTTGNDPGRARRLTMGLHSAISTAKGTGVHLDFVREDPHNVDAVSMPRRWPFELACAELMGLLGWPLGDDELPGMPRLHPKPLRPTSAVHSAERVFAASLAPGDNRSIGVAPADGLLHAVAYGPTNSGKSTIALALIEADMKAGRPVAVLDPKRQLIDDVLARVPKERLDDVVVLDVSQEDPVGFNPLDVSGRDPDVVVDGIMAVFGSLFSDGFGPRTLDIFSGTLRTLARASATSGTPATLADIPRILTDPAFRRSIVSQVQQDEGLAGFWSWYDNQSPQAQAAATSAPLNKLRQLLLRPALMRTLDQRDSPFRLRDIWSKNLIVLVPLNEALIGAGTAELFGSLIVADLWQAVQERASEQHPEKRPGFVYLDEAPRFVHLPTSLSDALAMSRSVGVGWFLAAQFTRQWPKELRSAIGMNARTKVVFSTEHEDAMHFARGSTDLTTEDFTSLGRFEAYANLAAAGQPQGWALVRTMPPSKPSVRPERVAAHSRARWATPKPVAAAGQSSPVSGASAEASDPSPGLHVGRKRRQP